MMHLISVMVKKTKSRKEERQKEKKKAKKRTTSNQNGLKLANALFSLENQENFHNALCVIPSIRCYYTATKALSHMKKKESCRNNIVNFHLVGFLLLYF